MADKKFQCGFCDHKADRFQRLLAHHKSKHHHLPPPVVEERRVPECRCQVCGSKLSTKYNLRVHTKGQHFENINLRDIQVDGSNRLMINGVVWRNSEEPQGEESSSESMPEPQLATTRDEPAFDVEDPTMYIEIASGGSDPAVNMETPPDNSISNARNNGGTYSAKGDPVGTLVSNQDFESVKLIGKGSK